MADQRVNGAHVCNGFGGGAHVGLGDNLQQRHPGAIEIDSGFAREEVMHGFSGVLLQVGASDSNAFGRAVVELDLQLPVLHDRELVLADLIPLGKVRIEVVLARKDRAGRDRGVRGKAEHHRHAQDCLVEYRQHAGKSQIYGAGLSVGLGPDRSRRAGEDLAPSRELRVNLESHHRFPRHGPQPSSSGEPRGPSQVPVGGPLVLMCDA